MRSLRGTALAATVTAILVAPATLLAEEPPAGWGTAARVAEPPKGSPTWGRATTVSGSSYRSATIAQATPSGGASVTIGDFFFQPRDLTVGVGEAITWTNDGTVREGHTVTGDGFDSGILKEGQDYVHTFTNPGTFRYLCTLHPQMKGSVTVTAADTAGGDEAPTTDRAGSDSGAPSAGVGSFPSESEAVDSASAGGTGTSLPATGLNVILVAEIGLCLIATGLLVRQLVRE